MRFITYTLFAACIFAASCSTPQKTIYFADNSNMDPHVTVEKMEPWKEATVQIEDILAINVTTISSIVDKQAAGSVSLFNQGGTSYSLTSTIGGAGGGGAGGSNNGYRVDAAGYIDYPIIGQVKVAGLTIRQVKELLASKLKDIVKEPVVEARIINYKITVLGEVGTPGTLIAPNQKISIIDALAAAGDVPITGRKDNVLVIRETEGRREFARLNLNSKNVFSSPYFYLKQNDVVYVEPARIRRQEANEFLKFYLPVVTTLLSTAITIYSVTQLTKRQ